MKPTYQPVITRPMRYMLAGVTLAGPVAYALTRIILAAHAAMH